jgi:hypothetical protein
MRVRVNYAEDVDDSFRRAINHHFGQDGFASREEVKRWFRSYGSSGNDDLMYDFDNAIKRGEVEPDHPWRKVA